MGFLRVASVALACVLCAPTAVTVYPVLAESNPCPASAKHVRVPNPTFKPEHSKEYRPLLDQLIVCVYSDRAEITNSSQSVWTIVDGGLIGLSTSTATARFMHSVDSGAFVLPDETVLIEPPGFWLTGATYFEIDETRAMRWHAMTLLDDAVEDSLAPSDPKLKAAWDCAVGAADLAEAASQVPPSVDDLIDMALDSLKTTKECAAAWTEVKREREEQEQQARAAARRLANSQQQSGPRKAPHAVTVSQPYDELVKMIRRCSGVRFC